MVIGREHIKAVNVFDLARSVDQQLLLNRIPSTVFDWAWADH